MKRTLLLFLILAAASLACGFRITLPSPPTPGPEVSEEIALPLPSSAEQIRLRLSFGAGNLKIAPGAEEALVEGTAKYNVPDLKPEIEISNGNVHLKQGDYEIKSFTLLDDIKNEWDLRLGGAPMDLSIQAGAYRAEYEFGGLALTGLTVEDGAADVELSFSSPNLAEMALLRYETGASDVTLTGLGNANFATLIFKGGAGDYTLDFSGELKRDAIVTVESGLSNLILVIPEGVHAVVTVESGLSNVSFAPGWSQNGNIYTQAGSGPTLTFIIKSGAGNLSLTR